MLCNMRDILAEARKGNFAIGSFNTPNLETLRAVDGREIVEKGFTYHGIGTKLDN